MVQSIFTAGNVRGFTRSADYRVKGQLYLSLSKPLYLDLFSVFIPITAYVFGSRGHITSWVC